MKKLKQIIILGAIHLCIFPMLATGSERIHELTEAQQKNVWKISGTVIDEEGLPLIGAAVSIKGQQKGTVTDVDGNFSIDASQGDVLEVNYMGYLTQSTKITSQNKLNITMREDAIALDEVAVTALGIKREKKALGYSVGEVKGEELEKAKETNVINALAGKVPGLVISQTAGGPSGSSRVMIRGNTELTGNNQPLYVVDGVPLDNSSFASADTYGGYDLGDGISSINPDDIENISILKGPAASALYGSRASHGVILITTKKAGGKKKLGFEFNSTTTIEQQLTKYDNLQTTYGQGSDGRISGIEDKHTSNKNWGPKIDEGLYITYFDGVQRPYKFIENNIDGFFRTGITTTNTLIMNSVREDTGVRLSYTNLLNRDIVPNADMSRNTINVRANTTFAKKLDLDVKVNYVREDVNNRPALSGHRANIGNNLITLATTFDQKWLKNNYRTAEGEYYDWNNRDPYNLNPYWITNEMENESTKDRFMGTGVIKYRINDKMNVRLTGGGEIGIMEFNEYAPPTTPGYESGMLKKTSFHNTTYNTELLFSYNDKKGDFDFGANLGGNIFFVDNKTEAITATNMQMRETVAMQSFLEKELTESAYRKQINSVFGMANVAYKNMLFLDATLRCDNSSTLPSHNNTYWYPSVSTSFLFTEALKINKDILSYGKVRFSAAQVGSDTDPYRLSLVYAMLDKTYGNYPLATINNSAIPNKNLKPTRTNSFEAGFDLKFFKNRIGLDFTYYSQNSRDQIMNINTTITSGYNSMTINAGEIENKGIEIVLNTRPIETRDLSWDLNFNFSKNSNKVKKLTPGIERFDLEAARWLDVTVAAVEGENYGAIMGRDFKRSPSGDVLIDPSNGYPIVEEELSSLGNATWDWTGGINTNLKYKNVSLSAIFDFKFGADLYSMSARSFYQIGKAKETLAGRDEWYESEEQRLAARMSLAAWEAAGNMRGFIAPGVVETIDENGNTKYVANTKTVNPEEYWKHIANNSPVPFISDNSYIKVREITLSYRFPKKLIGKYLDDLSVSFVTRNPFIIYKNVDNIDPDSNYNNGRGMGLEFGSLPSRRSYGVNLNVKF